MRNRMKRGFTLVEMVTACAVFSIGTVGIVQAHHFALDRIRTLKETAIADRVVQDEIERLRALPYAELADCAGAPVADPNPAIQNLARARTELTVEPYGDPALRLKHARVAVRWRADGARGLCRAADTLIGARAREAGK